CPRWFGGGFWVFLDYDSLRLGGLIVAGIFFVLGILLILSERHKIPTNTPKNTPPNIP
uniref:FXYD domain-containing ion transport regulator n=1 Tax=Serinus canaria TaxID=9135 RepID=A0A8C9MUL4_SERCA